MKKIDAIIAAGEKKGSQTIIQQNKAFLPLNGKPLIYYIIKALDQVSMVNSIIVVGPIYKLDQHLIKTKLLANIQKDVKFIEEKANLLENAKAGFVASIKQVPDDTPFHLLKNSQYENKSVFYLPSDIPLVTSFEINEFLCKADMENYDYSIGLCSEQILANYYPRDHVQGIRMSYFHTKDGRFRQNNFHLGKPLKVGNLIQIENMYEIRYQKKIINMIMMIFRLIKTNKKIYRSLWHYLLLQLGLFSYTYNLSNPYRAFTRMNSVNNILHCINHLLGTRTEVVMTNYGGAALDCDNAESYKVLSAMFSKWMSRQEKIAENIKQP